MKKLIQVTSDIVRTPRVMQVEGIFDVPPTQRSELTWNVDLALEDRPWQIGLIVGPSGCGKSTVAREFFGEHLVQAHVWPERGSILDGFPKGMSIKDVVGHLASVGFNSPPAWLRPFAVLSNGEQFRVTMARILADAPELAVVDEYTSVVDRTVAQIGSAALSKAIRRGTKKFVAVTCHMDVEPWLQPDWVYFPAEQRFVWRSLRRRPDIELTINRTSHGTWQMFKHHHYLSDNLNKAAFCFVAFHRGQPIGFDSWLPFFGRLKKGSVMARRGHRTVVLPDYQGVGIGRHLVDYCASMWSGLGMRVFSGVGHPAEIASRQRDGNWRCTRAPALGSGHGGKFKGSFAATRATTRLRASFEWVGKPMDATDARLCLETRHGC